MKYAFFKGRELVDVLDDKYDCQPYSHSGYEGHCGGCCACLIMQTPEDWTIIEDYKPPRVRTFIGDLLVLYGGKG